MAGKKQQSPKPIEEDEEAEEGWDSVADVDADAPDQAAGRMRDWRDVEKYREMRELRRLVGDEFDFSDVLGEIPIRTAQTAAKKANGSKAKAVAAAPPPPAKSKAPTPPPKPAAAPHKAAPAPAKAAPHKPAPAPKHGKPAHPPAHKHAKKVAKPAPKKAKAKKK